MSLRQFRLKEILDTESYTVTLTPGEVKVIFPFLEAEGSFSLCEVDIPPGDWPQTPGVSLYEEGLLVFSFPWLAKKQKDQKTMRIDIIKRLKDGVE